MTHAPGSFAVALQFEQTERVLSSVAALGQLVRLRLPGRIHWPDGSYSEFLEIAIERIADAQDELID